MAIDSWNPKTFDADILSVLIEYSKLISDYHVEDRRLIDEYFQESKKNRLGSNRFHPDYQRLHENTLTPIIEKKRVRLWHYTRLTDEETAAMIRQFVPSSLEYLRHRLENLVEKRLLCADDAETIYSQSVFHEQPIRAGTLYTTTLPIPPDDTGVEPLLENWGGEAAYFWLKDKKVAQILKNIGTPRIIEIETSLSEETNDYSIAGKILEAWAYQLGAPTTISGSDLAIRKCINTAKVLRIHTKGDTTFEEIGKTCPDGINMLQNNKPEGNGI